MKNYDVVRSLKKSVDGLLNKIVIGPAVIAAKAERIARIAKALKVEEIDQVPQSFQGEMAAFVREMETIFSGFATNANDVGPGLNGISKSIDVKVSQGTFVKWAQERIAKAIEHRAAGRTLEAIHIVRKLDTCLKGILDSAIKKGASFEDDSTLSFSVDNDPQALMWRQVDGSIVDIAGKNVAPSSFAEAPGATFLAIPLPSDGTAGSFLAEANGNTAPSNTIENPGDVNKAAAAAAETIELKKAAEAAVVSALASIRENVTKFDVEVPAVSWGMDLNRRDFMTGIHKEEFGRDDSKSEQSSWSGFRF